MEKDIINRAIDFIKDGVCDNMWISEIHNEIFDTGYFIIGRYEAEKWLEESEEGVFGAIGRIKEYEMDNFGELTTDISEPERVCDMYVYIKGEELLHKCSAIRVNWDNRLDETVKQQLLKELNEML